MARIRRIRQVRLPNAHQKVRPVTDFVHLHVHSDYSILDGAARVCDLAQRAAKYDMPALALTDHCNLSGAVEFFGACQREGIKPIIGCEFSVKAEWQPHHLTLLAAGNTGYRSLVALINALHLGLEARRGLPSHEVLAEHAGDLIALSGCARGVVPFWLRDNQPEEARAAAKLYREIFGEDNFFLELGASGTAEQDATNARLAELSAATGIATVATGNVHYLEPEDAAAREVLPILTGHQSPGELRVDDDHSRLHFMSAGEIAQVLHQYPAAVARSVEIAERCSAGFDLETRHAPRFPAPEGLSSGEYLHHVGLKGLKQRYGNVPPAEATQRFVHELEVISRLDFADDYLVAGDLVRHARESGIPVGPGRGASAGSILAYALGITAVDPLRFGLRFERFVNEKRGLAPDFDIEVCARGRRKLVKYLLSRYGPERAARPTSFRRRFAWKAVRSAGFVRGLPREKLDPLVRRIPRERWMSVARALDEDEGLRSLNDSDQHVRRTLDLARRLEGLIFKQRPHPAAVILSDEPLDRLVPLHRASANGVVTTQFDIKSCEALGLVKQNLLARRELTAIYKACARASEESGEHIDPGKFPLDEPRVYRMLARGGTRNIFEFGSSGVAQLVMQVAPDRFGHLVAIVALYRPGPLGSGMVEEYIAGRHGRAEPLERHPVVAEILAETYGVLLYQEQVMDIALRVAGIALGDGDLMRRALGKKIPEQMSRWRTRFIEGALERGTEATVAERLFNHMGYFSGYGFNKAHAVCCALLGYGSAYLTACFGVRCDERRRR